DAVLLAVPLGPEADVGVGGQVLGALVAEAEVQNGPRPRSLALADMAGETAVPLGALGAAVLLDGEWVGLGAKLVVIGVDLPGNADLWAVAIEGIDGERFFIAGASGGWRPTQQRQNDRHALAHGESPLSR